MDSDRRISGLFFSGESSLAEPAHVEFLGEYYRLEVLGRPEVVYTLSEVQISERVGSIPRAFTFPGGSRFESGSNDAVDAWHGGRARGGLAARLEANSKLAAASGIFLLCLLAFSYFVVFPRASAMIAQLLPRQVSVEVSRGILNWLDKASAGEPVKLPSGEMRKAERAYARVARAVPDLHLEFRTIGFSSMGPNAFALPDGTVVVIDSLVALLSEDEIISVLLHEAGHVSMKHGMSLLVETSLISLVVFAIAGGDGTALPLILLNTAYSRRHESEADAFAKAKLLSLGLSPKLLISALDKIGKDKDAEVGSMSFISTHPLNAERKRALEN